MDWKTFLPFALGTGLVTTILTQAWESLGKRFESSRQAGYLAIRLATILEQFAIDCAERIAGIDMYKQSEGHAGVSSTKLPELSPFPDEEKWNTLKPHLLARVLTLPNERSLGNGAIAFWFDVDPELMPTACGQQCGKVGYLAWTLACDLRSHYGFSPFDPKQTSWDMVETLKNTHDEVLQELIARRKPTAPD
jgi:hypothetical protein